jgi:sugar lactone lactonase YvrE
MRRLRILMLASALLLTVAAPASARTSLPEVIPLPDGFFPEGVTMGYGTDIYTGSLVDGAIWKGDVRSGEGEVLVDGVPGRLAVGMDFDKRSGHLFVAGGPTGVAYAYDGATGELLAEVALGAGFINDVIVTRTAAYFTNSFAPEIYAVPLGRNGAITGDAITITLGGDFGFVPGGFNANGIEATPSGSTLVVVNSSLGTLYRVDPTSGVASLIDLRGAVVNGDGLVLRGRTLYVVEGSKNQVTEVRLAANLKSGRVVDAITNDVFDVPTTADAFGKYLYVVSAKFNTPVTPDTPYEIVRVER